MDNSNRLRALALFIVLLCHCSVNAMVTTKPKLPHPLLTKRLIEEILYHQDKSYFTNFPKDISIYYILPMTEHSIAKDRAAHTRRNDDDTEELIRSLNSFTLSPKEITQRCSDYKKKRFLSFDRGITPYDFSLLTSMIVAENLIAAEILLSVGANVNSENSDHRWYYTPLIIAATLNNPEAVQLLIKYKAEVDLKPFYYTALWKAAELGFSEIVSILLNTQADPNAQNKFSKQTALYVAASGNHVEVVRLLLDAKVDPEIPDSRGFTPLMIASANGHFEVVSLLLSHKADPNKITALGFTALGEAANSGHLAVVTLLLDHHADPNLAPRNSNLFPRDDYKEIAELIASASPLDYAIRHNHTEVAELIKARGGRRGERYTD